MATARCVWTRSNIANIRAARRAGTANTCPVQKLMTLMLTASVSSALMLSPPRSALVPLSPRNYQVPLSMQLRNAAADMTDIVALGETLQIFVEVDEAAGSLWAEATVNSIDSDSGEFMVKVTEWDSLAKDDPAYEAAYEEGPFTAGEEGEEWRRPASAAPAKAAAPRVIATTPSPEEAAAVVAVASAAAKLKRCGVDGDESEWPQLAAAVEALYVALYNVGQPIATDRRLVGDWQLIGCTSPEVSRRKGLTGLGAAVFTKLGALHYSFAADGGAVARETLEFFGKPVILNELRGTLSFSADGRSMQEEYTEADMGGQQSTSVFSGSFSTLTASVISTDGTLRIGRGPDGVLVFRKVPPGGLAAWLEDQLLPSDGGTYLGNPTWKGPMERA